MAGTPEGNDKNTADSGTSAETARNDGDKTADLDEREKTRKHRGFQNTPPRHGAEKKHHSDYNGGPGEISEFLDIPRRAQDDRCRTDSPDNYSKQARRR